MQDSPARRLSQEEKDDLKDIIDNPGVKALLRLIELEAESIVNSVVKYDLTTGDERELIRLKCRAEGAVKLASLIRMRLASLNPKHDVRGK